MASSGEKFLEVTKATGLSVTRHALERIKQYTGLQPTRELAHALFRRGVHVRAQELFLLGYRPGLAKRRGATSWYFRFQLFGEELLAVIAQGDSPGEFVWVTTYGVNGLTAMRRAYFSGAVA